MLGFQPNYIVIERGKENDGKRKDLSVSGKRGAVSKGKGVPGMV
jgi:hypothetical protein